MTRLPSAGIGMGECDINAIPNNDDAHREINGAQQTRQEWVRANFTQIFGTSAEDLHAQGINPRHYAMDHRDEIRRFARKQRSQGFAVPIGRPSGNPGPDNGGQPGGRPTNRGGYGYGGGRRFGMGMRGGSAWIGILLVIFALRFLLVDSFVGTHAAIFWVLGIGGILLVVRVILFSWLRQRRFNRRQSAGGQRHSRSDSW
jgi:hypothetical protein